MKPLAEEEMAEIRKAVGEENSVIDFGFHFIGINAFHG